MLIEIFLYLIMTNLLSKKFLTSMWAQEVGSRRCEPNAFWLEGVLWPTFDKNERVVEG